SRWRNSPAGPTPSASWSTSTRSIASSAATGRRPTPWGCSRRWGAITPSIRRRKEGIMKLVTFETDDTRHIGALLPGEREAVDLTASDGAPHFRDMLALIDGGAAALDQ